MVLLDVDVAQAGLSNRLVGCSCRACWPSDWDGGGGLNGTLKLDFTKAARPLHSWKWSQLAEPSYSAMKRLA